MQFASSDIEAATVADLGLRAAVEQIAARKAEEARLLADMQRQRLEQEHARREALDRGLEDAEDIEHRRIMAAYRAEPWIDATEIIAQADPALPRYDFHPDNLFPLMNRCDFAALVRSIRERGQFEPIHLFEGKNPGWSATLSRLPGSWRRTPFRCV